MGQNVGQLISKLVGNLWDIDIKNSAVSLINHTGCICDALDVIPVAAEDVLALVHRLVGFRISMLNSCSLNQFQ